MAESEHLLTRQAYSDRAFKLMRRQDGQEYLILRSQPQTERSPDKRRDDANVVFGQTEDVADVFLDVLHPLRFVINGKFAGAFPDDGRRERLHRIVMLKGRAVFSFKPRGGVGKGFFGVAARFGQRRENWSGFRYVGFIALFFQISGVRFAFVLDSNERRRITRQLEVFGHDQRDGLRAVPDLIVVKRAKRRAGGRGLVGVTLVRLPQSRSVFMGEDLQYAFESKRVACVKIRDSPFGDRARNNITVGEIRDIVFGGVLRRAGNFGASVNAADRLSDVTGRHVFSPFRRLASKRERWRASPARS